MNPEQKVIVSLAGASGGELDTTSVVVVVNEFEVHGDTVEVVAELVKDKLQVGEGVLVDVEDDGDQPRAVDHEHGESDLSLTAIAVVAEDAEVAGVTDRGVVGVAGELAVAEEFADFLRLVDEALEGGVGLAGNDKAVSDDGNEGDLVIVEEVHGVISRGGSMVC